MSAIWSSAQPVLAQLSKSSLARSRRVWCLLQKQPAKRRSSAAAKAGGARGSKATAAATLATAPGAPASAAGASKQDWRTAKVQKQNAVPIGKQLKVGLYCITCAWHAWVLFCNMLLYSWCLSAITLYSPRLGLSISMLSLSQIS